MKKAKIVCFSVSAVIIAIVLALNIAVGIFAPTIDMFVIGYKTGADTGASRAKGADLVEQIQKEGTVLLKNDELLPLSKQDVPKVNVFGWASVDWVFSGSGSGQTRGNLDGSGGATKMWDLLNSLTDYGVEYNTELTDMYKAFQNRRYKASPYNAANSDGTLHSFNYEFSRLYEPKIEDYSADILANAKSYSNTALVVLGRNSGESNDSPKVQYKKTLKSTASSAIDTTDTERTYLEISTEEEALLKYVGENYENVVVLINSTNVIELGFLDKIGGLDACFLVATTGSAGARAIPKLLYGEYTPSGKTADTFAYDLTTSSTYVNVGSGIKNGSNGADTTNFYSDTIGGNKLYPTNHDHTNGSANIKYTGVAYTDYAEGIYVGYKWYETADAAGFWDSQRAKEVWGVEGYDQVVQFPFGFGLSYAEFEWTITKITPANNAEIDEDTEIEIDVMVTNVGDHPGQDVVELYYTPPYQTGEIEKSAVNLVAFAKTQQVLYPLGKYPADDAEHPSSETVALKFKAGDMKSYDFEDKNGNGFKGYELEGGNYTLSLRTDAHTLASDRIVNGSAEITYQVSTGIKIYYDDATDNEVMNRFTGSDATDGVAIDGNSDNTAAITYLSRADFVGTFPYVQKENRAMDDRIKALNLYTKEMAAAWDVEHDTATIETGKDGEKVYDGALTELGKLLGQAENFDNDALWDPVLDQLTVTEMQNLVLHGYIKTGKLDSIGKPQTLDLDGPNQIGSFSDSDLNNGTTGFSSIVLAQSWNVELAYSMGLTVATECADRGINGWYGPAINLHRSPFGGRNYEYYSEDALLSGLMSARAVQAAKNGGVFSYLKHLCLYESESNRDGMYNWITEQALRETYIKPFEICVKEGGASGIMTSYGRIGAVWTGGSEALLTEVVRGEWGFKGAIITDYADYHDFMNGDQMVRAGGDIWMDGWSSNGSFAYGTSSNAFKASIRRASKDVIYMWANALATQENYNADEDVVPIHTASRELNFRWYIPVLVAVDVIALGGCGFWIFMVLRKKKAAPAETGDGDNDAPAQE